MTTTLTARPPITTLAFQANAQAIVGHLVQGNHDRARTLLADMGAEQLGSLHVVAGTITDLVAAERTARGST